MEMSLRATKRCEGLDLTASEYCNDPCDDIPIPPPGKQFDGRLVRSTFIAFFEVF